MRKKITLSRSTKCSFITNGILPAQGGGKRFNAVEGIMQQSGYGHDVALYQGRVDARLCDRAAFGSGIGLRLETTRKSTQENGGHHGQC